MKSTPIIQLGFSEPRQHSSSIGHESPNWKQWDGGKIGGKPSWLNPRDLPRAPLRCQQCISRDGTDKGTILRFIAQLYSPADEDTNNINAYHRSIYIFACPHPKCSLPQLHRNSSVELFKSVTVLRCQLPKMNEFYPSDDCDTSWIKHTSEYWNVHLCIVCGQRATGQCPKMKQWFCSKEHQIEYYKLNNADKSNEKCYESIYEESELIVEDEPPEVSMTEDELNKVVQSSMFIGDQEDDDKLDTWDQKNLNQISGIGDRGVTDTTTIEFYTRIGRANGDVRGQCLRYCRWPSPEPTLTQHVETNDCNDGDDDFHESVIPLWLSSLHQPQTKDIPHCECCGSERRYEFQIMPQMLHFLFKDKNKKEGEKIDSTLKDTMLAAASIIEKATEEGLELEIPHEIQKAHDELKGKIRKNLIDYSSPLCLDWGIISVYTCVQSCDGRNRRSEDYVAYTPEFAWRQPPLSYDENSN